jgi:hypothetical protein
MTKTEIEQMLETALEPLRQEIAELREQLAVKGEQSRAAKSSQEQETAAETISAPLEPSALEPSAVGDLPITPPERKDFQRFLQRGLEEEQVRYSEEAVADKPAAKKGGWNPFRR